MRDEILNGIRDGQFHVVYQPQMTADGSRIVAVEALVRWAHPRRGPLGPDHFIKIAEDESAIFELGAFVLRRACHDALQWPGIAVSVNVSGLQLQAPGFAEFVETEVRESGLLFHRLELEIVESAVIENFEPVVEILHRFRSLGIKIALDDFGTGYSSLSYLRKLPLDKLKIDKSFVDEAGCVMSASIIQAVIAMARAIGLKVTAEGVETIAQQQFLRVCGCHYLQGYLFSKPVISQEITRMLESGQTVCRAG